jgi:hypothetical protein
MVCLARESRYARSAAEIYCSGTIYALSTYYVYR